jgi:hypothetical protein
VTRYSSTTQGYSEDQYRSLLENAGFKQIEIIPSLTGYKGEFDRNFLVVRAAA